MDRKILFPLVIGDTLDEVATWAEQQESSTDDEKELLIKVSKKSREIYAGCEVDDMQMQIVIRLPATYPLEGVKVDGINRVAVTEKKWQNWLMITQGVITFSVRLPTPFFFPMTVPTDRLPLVISCSVLTESPEWLHNRRPYCLQEKRNRGTEGTNRVRHLLLDHIRG